MAVYKKGLQRLKDENKLGLPQFEIEVFTNRVGDFLKQRGYTGYLQYLDGESHPVLYCLPERVRMYCILLACDREHFPLPRDLCRKLMSFLFLN